MKSSRAIGFAIGRSILILAAAAAQGAEQFVVRTWQAEDGLPQNSGTALVQTSDGYLWIGTFNGLVRFNGVHFTRFTIGNTKEFPSGDINELYEDRSGRLWIGMNGGLVTYERGQFKHWRSPESLSHASIYNFAETREGDILIAGFQGVWRVTEDQATEVIIPDAKWPTRDSAVAADSEGNAWLTHGSKLYRAQGKELRFEAEMEQPIGLLSVARDGTVWFRNATRMIQRRPNTPPQEAEFDVGKVAAFLEARDGGFWIGSAENGLFRWRDGELTAVTTAHGLGSNRILALAEDREGNLWAGTDGGGFSRVNRAQVTTYGAEHGLAFPDVLSISEDRAGQIWLGLFGGALSVGQNGQWRRHPAPSILGNDETVSSLCHGRDGTLWIGRYMGSLCRIRDGLAEPETRSQLNRIRALFEDRENRLWIGSSDQGLESILGEKVTHWSKANGLSDNRVTAIAQDGAGAIWIGTDNGLNRISDGKVEQFFAKDGLGSSQVHSLFTDREGVLWIGTPGAGITRRRAERFAVATSQQGLHSDVIGQILEDDEAHLWIGSTTGIFRVDKQSLHDVLDGRSRFARSTVFGRKDGMRAAGCPGGFQPVCMKSRDGRLWFCTSAGVTVIDPRTLRRTDLPPPVHIERLIVDGIELDARTNSLSSPARGAAGDSSTRAQPAAFRVPPGARRLEIHCTALSLSDPEHAQFKFWLENYEEDWQEAGPRRAAYYSGVPPGAYRFHAKAANSNGIWNEAGATVDLVIQPAWHQSAWFRSAAAAAGLAALFGVYRLKVGGLHKARAQHAAFSRRLIESQEAERKRIAGELHDSLGQSLLVINNRSRLVLNSPSTLETAQEQLREISNLASQAVEEVRTIAQNLRPYQLDRLGLTRALHFLLQNVASASAIRVVDEIDPVDNLLPREVEVHVFRITQEFLNNAVKHSAAGEMRVSIRRGEKKLEFAFEDDGCGFDLRAENAVGGRDRGLGLQSMTERLRILSAKADFQSQPGRGTRLRFTLPLPFLKHESPD